MTKLKWAIRLFLLLIIAAFFHYNLPSRDVVQVVGTEVKRCDLSMIHACPDGSDPDTPTRDVRFISATYDGGDPRVYRNEDTGFGFPPYLKFNSSNVDATAKAFEDTGKWVAVSHYGWRIEFFSMFPNAYKLKEVSGPDVRLIPWFNIIFFIVLAMILWAIYVRVRRWKDRNVDPYLEDIGDAYEDASDAVNNTKGRIGRWLDTWKTKK